MRANPNGKWASARRITIVFQPGDVEGYIAESVMRSDGKYAWSPYGGTVTFTPAQFAAFDEYLKEGIRSPDFNPREKAQMRRVRNYAIAQYGYELRTRPPPAAVAENPLGDFSPLDWLLIAGGVGLAGYVAYLVYSAASAPTSPALSAASSGAPTPQPVSVESTGLASGYYWEDAGNTTTPGFGSTVMAIAMTPDDVAEAIYGRVYVPLSPGGNTSFIVTGQSPVDPNSGISMAQSITLPLSYISASS
jgi:hypothetical protein